MKSFLFTISLLAATLCHAQSEGGLFSIKAFLPFWNNSFIRLKIDDRLVHMDTLKGDMYSFTGLTDGVRNGMLEIEKDNRTLFLSFFIEPGTIKIRDKGNKVLLAWGTPSNDTYLSLMREWDFIAESRIATPAAQIKKHKKQLAAVYIKKHPQSLISLQLLHDFYYLDNATDDTAYFRLIYALDKPIKETALAKKVTRGSIISEATGIKAANLIVADTSGKVSNLYPLGVVTLLHFWSSWCVPCRKENPALKKLYAKYGSSGFTIVGISLDADPALWKKAIQYDGLNWKQVSDLKGWRSSAAKTFGIKTIPANFLLDANGVIIATDLQPEQLDLLLSGYLQPKVL